MIFYHYGLLTYDTKMCTNISGLSTGFRERHLSFGVVSSLKGGVSSSNF